MYIDKFKKIVIKIGSSILINKKGKLKKIWLNEFAKDIQNQLNAYFNGKLKKFDVPVHIEGSEFSLKV